MKEYRKLEVDQINYYLAAGELHVSLQSGYIADHITETAIEISCETLLVVNKCVSVFEILDLSAVFDTISRLYPFLTERWIRGDGKCC